MKPPGFLLPHNWKEEHRRFHRNLAILGGHLSKSSMDKWSLPRKAVTNCALNQVQGKKLTLLVTGVKYSGQWPEVVHHRQLKGHCLGQTKSW